MNRHWSRLICRITGRHADPVTPPMYGHIVRGCRRCGVLAVYETSPPKGWFR